MAISLTRLAGCTPTVDATLLSLAACTPLLSRWGRSSVFHLILRAGWTETFPRHWLDYNIRIVVMIRLVFGGVPEWLGIACN